ncbi:pancreatic secretory granule membrane major glycoprotein GP2-like isoform 2-T2 [Mantella aurantiaca]
MTLILSSAAPRGYITALLSPAAQRPPSARRTVLQTKCATKESVCATPTSTRIREDGPRSYVTNSITIHAKSNSSAAINPINFTITCPLYTGTDPNTQTVIISGVSGFRLYPLTMSAYKDSEFRSPYVSTEIVLGSKIYVALYVYYKDGDAYVLRLQDCAASPTPERNNTKAFHLISEGCAADNLTRIIQNGNSTEVRMEISYSRFRNFDTIYLFCDARLCKKSGEECNMCKVSQAFSMNVTELQLNLMVRGKSQLSVCTQAALFTDRQQSAKNGLIHPAAQSSHGYAWQD